MIKIGQIEIGKWFSRNDCTYEVIDYSYCFVKAKKIPNDGFTHYFLKDLEVKRAIKDFYQYKNPNHVISDLRKQNLD